MSLTDPLYLIFSAGLLVAVVTMLGVAIRAYIQTERIVMVYLSIGFALIVAAAVATTVGAFLDNFQNPRKLLLLNNGFAMCGYLFMVYSVVSYD